MIKYLVYYNSDPRFMYIGKGSQSTSSSSENKSNTGNTASPSGPAKIGPREWETLVLFAVNLSRLDVVVNMSNVMGNTT